MSILSFSSNEGYRTVEPNAPVLSDSEARTLTKEGKAWLDSSHVAETVVMSQNGSVCRIERPRRLKSVLVDAIDRGIAYDYVMRNMNTFEISKKYYCDGLNVILLIDRCKADIFDVYSLSKAKAEPSECFEAYIRVYVGKEDLDVVCDKFDISKNDLLYNAVYFVDIYNKMLHDICVKRKCSVDINEIAMNCLISAEAVSLVVDSDEF